MTDFQLSPAAKRRSLKLRLEIIERKIASIEGEIQLVERGSPQGTPRLFEQEPPGLASLRERHRHLLEIAAKMQGELRKI